jgi:hypothetical protein
VLRVYLCRIVSGELTFVDHDEHRWLTAAELDDVQNVYANFDISDEVLERVG